MTNRERELIALLKTNPMISQKDIAEKLGIQRSSVAAHILNLTKKGLIKGKGYILSEGEYVLVIGGAAMDITGFPKAKLRLEDSNPGAMKTSMGGVGRNIGENLARLGVDVKMLTALGDDVYGHKIVDTCERLGMDFSNAMVLNDEDTATYMAILDEEGDMKVAISNMGIIERIDIDFIRKNERLIRNAAAIVVDTNLDQKVIEYIAHEFSDCPLFVDTVSTAKAEKLRRVIGAFHTIKPNRLEAQLLSGIDIKNDSDLLKVKDWFIAQGVKHVFISLGKDGVFYGDEAQHHMSSVEPVTMVSATGAGDAFMAGLVYGHLHQMDMAQTVKVAQVMSALTVSSAMTIHPEMSESMVKSLIQA